MSAHHREPPPVYRALLRKLLSGSVVGRSILGDLEEEYQRRLRRDRRSHAAAWFRAQSRRLLMRELRERLTTSSAWRRREHSRAREAGPTAGPLRSGIVSLLQDGRYALRSVAVSRWRSVAAVALLALAIGIATAMFTVVDALVLRPVPFEDAQQLAQLAMRSEERAPGFVPVDVFEAWKRSSVFEGVAAEKRTAVYVENGDIEVRSLLARITPGVFALLGGVRPLHGRLFDPSDGQPGTEERVLLSEDLWRTLYLADPSVVGGTIPIDGTPMHVVGILPSDFRFPSARTEIWQAETFEREEGLGPTVYVRFASTIPRADALRRATEAAHAAHDYEPDWRAVTWPLGENLDDYYARAVPLLSGAVVLLFLVLCANVAGLLLTGLAARAHELGTRAALGASRMRLVRQAFLEATLLGAAGVVAGVGLGWLLVSASRSILPEAAYVHSLNTLDIDLRALAVTSIAGLAATLGVGVLPAVAGTRVETGRLLQMTGRATATGRTRSATRALLVGQIALSCTLVFGATMLVRSFVNLVGEDRGLDVDNVLTADISFPSEAAEEARAALARAIEDEVRGLPGVTAVSWSYGTPPGGGVIDTREWTSDLPGTEPIEMRVYRFIVDARFFDLYRVPILRGRAFRASDDWTAVLVSERFARALWPGRDPMGRTFTFGEPGRRVRLEVIGVVQDVRLPSLDSTIDSPQIYTQWNGSFVARDMLSFRCAGPCPDPARVRQRLTSAHPAANEIDITSPKDRYLREFVRPRAAATLAAAFAATALIAAAAGLFGLFSQSVLRRRRELGIRTALGASHAQLRRVIWNEGVLVTALGIALGALVSYSLTRALSSLLYEVAPTDPTSWAVVAVTLAAAIAAAAWLPTRTAVRASPVVLLREE